MKQMERLPTTDEPLRFHLQPLYSSRAAIAATLRPLPSTQLEVSMKVALYARVSTNNGQHPEMQLGELREYAGRRGWEVSGEYVDAGVSGARERRPALDRLWVDCRN